MQFWYTLRISCKRNIPLADLKTVRQMVTHKVRAAARPRIGAGARTSAVERHGGGDAWVRVPPAQKGRQRP